MLGGILAWEDRPLPDFPRLHVFAPDGDPAAVLLRAMDLERGAERFYHLLLERSAGASFAPFVELLARAEEGHARLLYGHYRHFVPDAPDFPDLYASLSGGLIEGGQSLEQVTALLERIPGHGCLDVMELAITIEYAAYDLYRNLAERFRDRPGLGEALYAVAQAEKEHMRIAAEGLALCGQ